MHVLSIKNTLKRKWGVILKLNKKTIYIANNGEFTGKLITMKTMNGVLYV